MQIHVDRISFSYGSAAPVLQSVSFEITGGERVALIGHNGSGKSTLVKHLNGLLKPSTGTVWIGDKDTQLAQTPELATQVALLFQNPDDQICKREVRAEVAFGPKNLGYAKQRIDVQTEDALELFELTRFATRNPHDLGYSERKRLTMASIVAMDTPALVFDEPTAGLDPYEIALFISALDRLQRQGKTVIIITHDMDFVAENIQRAIALTQGRKRFDGRVADLFQHPSLMAECGLIAPQVVQLGTALSLPTLPLSPAEWVAAFAEKSASHPSTLKWERLQSITYSSPR